VILNSKCYKDGILYKERKEDSLSEVYVNGKIKRYNPSPHEGKYPFTGKFDGESRVKHYVKTLDVVPFDCGYANNSSFGAFGYYSENGSGEVLDAYFSVNSPDDYVRVCAEYELTASDKLFENIENHISMFGVLTFEHDGEMCLHSGCIGSIVFIDNIATHSKLYFNVPS
jgi:hypothetical protein